MEMKLETTTNTSVSKLKTYADLSFSSYIDLPRQKTKWKDIDWNRVLEGDICADKYFMRSGLVRKDLLLLYAKEHVPKTFVIKSFDEMIHHFQNLTNCKNDQQLWVLKYADSSNANGLRVFHRNKPQSVRDHFKCSSKRKHLLQEYITPFVDPKDPRKFHLRVIVLAVGKLKVFRYNDIRVLRCSKPYTEDGDSLEDPFVHISNQSVNEKFNTEGIDSCRNISLNDFCRKFTCENKYFGPNDEKETLQQFIISKIDNIVHDLFTRLSQNRRHFFTLPNCYELFGFDFMIDSESKVWLLEVNPDPSLALYCEEPFKFPHVQHHSQDQHVLLKEDDDYTHICTFDD